MEGKAAPVVTGSSVWRRRLVVLLVVLGMMAGLVVDTDHDGLTDDFPSATVAVIAVTPTPSCRRQRRRPQGCPSVGRSPAVIHAEQTEPTYRWTALLARWTAVYSTGPPA